MCQVGADLYHADKGTDGQTDRHDEANSLFSQFCEREYKRNNSHAVQMWKNKVKIAIYFYVL